MEKIVAFDIGTRSVVGIMLDKQEGRYEVTDFVSVEHKERSMLDGQIHDILSVSNTIIEVKKLLEEKHGPIQKVCVAAAGRALKTLQTTVEKDITNQPLITTDDILHLELSAVQQAQFDLANEMQDESTNYYCAGYSVLHYKLDGSEIGSLIDQTGKKAEVEIIATFLPKVVVESLISALHRAQLEMDALTLEPIAAINVLIPPSMRRLNVALVDIGAGTSDIAITNYGTVIGYGMVPIAGDEITDAISQHYLLDFPLAEKVKREITTNGKAIVQDILGFESEITLDELSNHINETIEQLANGICEEILQLNHKAPQAVMLVGGGSLTPNLTKKIAELLKLPENRVAIRGTEAIQDLRQSTGILPEGPAFVTPIGIAIAAKQNPIHYITTYVNERPVRLFDLKQLTVGDVLLAAGIQMKKLYGKPGMAIMVNLNGKDITIPGTLGNAPTLLRNGENATLKDTIAEGDRITVIPGDDGKDPVLTVEELVGEVPQLEVLYNGNSYQISEQIIINGIKAQPNTFLQDRDIIIMQPIQTIQDFLYRIKEESLLANIKPFTFVLNNKKVELPKPHMSILRNHKPATPNTTVKNGDHIRTTTLEKITVKEVVQLLDMNVNEELPVTFNGKKYVIQKPIKTFYRNEEPLNEEEYIHNGEQLVTHSKESEPFIFQDIFRYIDIDLSNLKGKQFKLYVNEKEANFMTPLAPHDQLKLIWVESAFHE